MQIIVCFETFYTEHIFEVYILCSAWILQCTSIIGYLLNLCQRTADLCGPITVTVADDRVHWQAVVSSVIYSFLSENLGNFLTRWATLVSQGFSGVRVKGFIFFLAKVRYVVAMTLTYLIWCEFCYFVTYVAIECQLHMSQILFCLGQTHFSAYIMFIFSVFYNCRLCLSHAHSFHSPWHICCLIARCVVTNWFANFIILTIVKKVNLCFISRAK